MNRSDLLSRYSNIMIFHAGILTRDSITIVVGYFLDLTF